MNRLVEPTHGTIYLNGEDTGKVDVIALRRSIGYVIQDVGLFPHMTVAQNISLVPRLIGWSDSGQGKADRRTFNPRWFGTLGLSETVTRTSSQEARDNGSEWQGGWQQILLSS